MRVTDGEPSWRLPLHLRTPHVPRARTRPLSRVYSREATTRRHEGSTAEPGSSHAAGALFVARRFAFGRKQILQQEGQEGPMILHVGKGTRQMDHEPLTPYDHR